MTRRSPYHIFHMTVLAALAIAVGAILTAPVGASAVLVVMEPAPQETLESVPSPVLTVSAGQVSQLESEVTESSGIAPPADDPPSRHRPSRGALVENFLAESCGEYVTTALSTVPQYPLLGFELIYMMCYHKLQGCHAGCTAVVEAGLALGLIEPEEADAAFYACVADYCPEGSVQCMTLFPGLGF